MQIMEKSGLEKKWKHLNDSIYGHERLTEGKVFNSSSDAENSPAKNAFDGDWNSFWSTKSGGDGQGSLSVDLGSPHVIQRVSIIPRQDRYDEDMQRNIEIQASNDRDFKTFSVLCERNDIPWCRKPGKKNVTNMWEQYIPELPPFRYIRVKATNPAGELNLAEFEVFGYPEKKP
ncbi:MAG TPA: discoidin domain-containing protein [Victivallales bacterium]|nr:discoidin domain-containing protein [Victivallales bacterium]